jgi:hypothetical protein
MKKIVVLASCMAAGALSVHAQGVVWNNHEPGAVVSHIYGPDAADPSSEESGNIATAYSGATPNGDFPTGSTVYGGTLLGGSAAGATAVSDTGNGSIWSAALYGAPGSGDAVNTLTLVPGSTTTLNVSNVKLAGFVVAPASDPVVTGSAYGGTVTLQAVAWYNNGGQYGTLAAAEAANVPTGESTPFNVTLAGSPTASDPVLTGLTSFDLTTTSTPEPSTIALGVMGASAFLLRRRMSK